MRGEKKPFLSRKIGRFTFIELLIACSVAAILFTLGVPSMVEAQKRAKFVRWLAYNKTCSNEPSCVINFNFQDGAGSDYLMNTAKASGIRNEPDVQYDGQLMNRNGGAHKFEWKKAGRWGHWKKALQFNGTDTYVKVPAYNVAYFNPAKDSFTVYVWAKFDEFSIGRVLFSKANWGTATYSSSIFDMYSNKSGANEEFCVDNFTVCESWPAKGENASLPTGFDVTGWNQIGMRYNAATGKMDGFVNGRSIGNTISYLPEQLNDTNMSAVDWVRSIDVPFLLGAVYRQTGPSNPSTIPQTIGGYSVMFKGLMDEFIMYNRGMTDSELYANYLMGKE